MAQDTITLHTALADYLRTSGKTIADVNRMIYVEPFGADPFLGGDNYLDLVARGRQGNDPLHGPQYEQGAKLLAAFLIKERGETPSAPQPTRTPPAAEQQHLHNRRVRQRRPKPDRT